MGAVERRPLADGLVVYGLALLVGAVVGWRFSGIPPHAVSAAAALAGLAPYFPDSIPYRVALDSVSAVNQAVAALFGLGFEAADLSRAIHAFQGALYCSAAALLIHALSRQVAAALAGGVLFLLLVPYAGGIDYSDYIVVILGPPTYGIVALGLVLTLAAMLACGWTWAGLAVVAVTVLAHPVLGLFAALLWAASLILPRGAADAGPDRPLIRLVLAAALPALLFVLRRDAPAAGEAETRLIGLYLAQWDYHRNVPLDAVLALAVAQVAALAALAAAWRRSDAAGPVERRFALFVVLAAASGVLLYLGFHALRDVLPTLALMVMPNRLINIGLVLTFPVLAGLALRHRGAPSAWAALAVLVAVPPLAPLLALPALVQPAAAVVAALLLALALRRSGAAGDSPPDRLEARLLAAGLTPWRRRMAVAVLVGAGLAGLGTRPVQPMTAEKPPAKALAGLFREIGGPILAANPRVQEVLVDIDPGVALALDLASLDFLPYLPHLGPRVAAILTELYNVDFDDPPAFTRRRGELILEDAPLDKGGETPTRVLWEALTRAQWLELAQRFGFRAVAAPAGWKLDLPRDIHVKLGPDWGLRIWRLS